MAADHVVVTVSLGVLKGRRGGWVQSQPSVFQEGSDPDGWGSAWVNKLFMEVEGGEDEVPSMELAFEQEEGSKRHVAKIPWWMRRTASICPIYGGSRVLLSWFAGKEAAELEKLSEEEIISGVHATLDGFSAVKVARRCNGSAGRVVESRSRG
ncbi:hypothetical protein J5N97_025697 [Dioscorea zingiberensis]|uniref:Amine oxidase domain-containing protein n=1 Tax=Dioscorea zingiberensis TaxID=325984 RepID=A0A9D5C1A5_9LILI|nr:hypothetical protein J5N97_025697 [Dioscorea zingiberensis]